MLGQPEMKESLKLYIRSTRGRLTFRSIIMLQGGRREDIEPGKRPEDVGIKSQAVKNPSIQEPNPKVILTQAPMKRIYT
jgi:hypothetical protein